MFEICMALDLIVFDVLDNLLNFVCVLVQILWNINWRGNRLFTIWLANTPTVFRLPKESIIASHAQPPHHVGNSKMVQEFVPFTETMESRHVEVFSSAISFIVEFAMCDFQSLKMRKPTCAIKQTHKFMFTIHVFVC